MPKTGAVQVVESLVAAGVKHLFTLSGNQILPIYDAAIGRDIRLIHTRHEAAAIHMADGWGRLKEEPGVALLTAGPGHCNAPTALYVAKMAESPLLMLSGHCPVAQIGRGAFQEIDQVAVVEPVSKAAWLVQDPTRLQSDVALALSIARSGRPGPVHLSLPVDVLESGLPDEHAYAAPVRESVDPPEDIPSSEILGLLSSAQRPLILTGPAMGRPRGWAAVERLSHATGVPALSMESPRGVDDPALRAAANCLAQADVVLLAGKKLDFSLRYGQSPDFSEGCRFVQLDADEEELRVDKGVALAVHADPVSALCKLSEAARGQSWQKTEWQSRVTEARVTSPPEWQTPRMSSQEPVHPLRVCEALQPFLDSGAILVSDGGEFGQWCQAGVEARTRLINGPSGAIGSALPMGVAARLAYPDRTVFVVLGDGTFGYHAMELDTALRYDLPIVVVVGNDARWNAEHQLQLRNYGPGRTIGCDLLSSRYDRIAEALGGHGEFVRKPEDLAGALHRAVASGLPACVNIEVESLAAPTFRSSS